MSQAVTITPPDTTLDRAVGSALVAEASALAITDDATHAAAGELIRRCAAVSKAIEAKLAPAIDAAHKAHKGMTALRSELTAPFAAARKIIEPKIIAYQDAERRRREAEAARAAEEARRAAEQAQIDAAAEVAEFDPDAADAILDEPVYAPPVVAEAPRVEGVSVRETWRAEVTDFAALVASGRMELLLPNQPALDALARALKSAGSIPGVRFVAVRSATVRS